MAIGAAVGMVVGQKVEKILSTKKAQELTIEMDGGETVIIVQEKTGSDFHPDELVQVYSTRLGASRVFHMDDDLFFDVETNAYIMDEEDPASNEMGGVTFFV